MAGQARRGTRRPGRSSTDASSPAAAAPSAVASGSPTDRTNPTRTSGSPVRPPTRATYRSLLLKGLAPDEAANLTAFLCGIPVAAQHWKLGEVNRLIFLRELQEGGRFGHLDGDDRPDD